MGDNIQTTITGQVPPCLQQTIEKTCYLVEIHFSETSTQSVKNKLKRVILKGRVLDNFTQQTVVEMPVFERSRGNYPLHREKIWRRCVV